MVLSFLSGMSNWSTMIFSAPIMMSWGMMMRMGRMAPSNPVPANKRMISGAKISMKQMMGKEKMNRSLNDISEYSRTLSNLFSFINTLIRGIITAVSVPTRAMIT